MSRGKGRGRGCGRGTGLGLAESQAPVQEETDDMFREEVGPRWWLMSDRARDCMRGAEWEGGRRGK